MPSSRVIASSSSSPTDCPALGDSVVTNNVHGARCRRSTAGVLALSGSVVEGERRETRGLLPRAEARRHLVERDQLKAALVQHVKGAVEELGGDLEKPVRRESAPARGGRDGKSDHADALGHRRSPRSAPVAAIARAGRESGA